jgi:hypothetical protein
VLTPEKVDAATFDLCSDPLNASLPNDSLHGSLWQRMAVLALLSNQQIMEVFHILVIPLLRGYRRMDADLSLGRGTSIAPISRHEACDRKRTNELMSIDYTV